MVGRALLFMVIFVGLWSLLLGIYGIIRYWAEYRMPKGYSMDPRSSVGNSSHRRVVSADTSTVSQAAIERVNNRLRMLDIRYIILSFIFAALLGLGVGVAVEIVSNTIIEHNVPLDVYDGTVTRD